MIKTSCLVLFRLAQSCIIYVKLEEDDIEINIASQLSSIDQSDRSKLRLDQLKIGSDVFFL